MNNSPVSASQKLLHWLEYAILVVITLATVVAVGQELFNIIRNLEIHVSDLLLLFIYLEVVTMVLVYLESGSVPVRMPLYIAMVALARYLILDMKNMTEWQMLAISGSVLVIAVAVLIVRFGHVKYPYEKGKL